MAAVNLTDLGAACLLGLLGTGHCLGMCGPLVLAFPGQSNRLSGHAAYHAGRLTTYVVVGAVLGAIGQGLSLPPRSLVYTQVLLSLLAALLLALLGLARLGILPEPRWLGLAPVARVARSPLLQAAAAGQGGLAPLLGTGLLMGLLPCGLSYGAFVQALASRHLVSGAVLCLAFGVGTLPGLLALGGAAGRLMGRQRRVGELLAGMLMLAMALRLASDALAALGG